MARIFTENVEKIADPGVKAVVNDLLLLYLNYELTECSAGLLEVRRVLPKKMDGYWNLGRVFERVGHVDCPAEHLRPVEADPTAGGVRRRRV